MNTGCGAQHSHPSSSNSGAAGNVLDLHRYRCVDAAQWLDPCGTDAVANDEHLGELVDEHDRGEAEHAERGERDEGKADQLDRNPAADTAKARTFYGDLFGWGTSEFGGEYHVIDNGPAGTITVTEDPFTHPREYFATDDIDASVKRRHELGGCSEDVQTVSGVGRIARCHDDQGTPFSLYEPATQS